MTVVQLVRLVDDVNEKDHEQPYKDDRYSLFTRFSSFRMRVRNDGEPIQAGTSVVTYGIPTASESAIASTVIIV